MSQKVQEKIGQDYMTFDNSQKNNEHGIGLGLSLCKQLISKMGPLSKFYVKSIEDIGTKIGFLLYKEESQPNIDAELEKAFHNWILTNPFIQKPKELPKE
jgi:K+-sensing histidine kinase KdpD